MRWQLSKVRVFQGLHNNFQGMDFVTPFCNLSKENNLKKRKETAKKEIIAYRKSCDPKGTGLSHYIFSDVKKGNK